MIVLFAKSVQASLFGWNSYRNATQPGVEYYNSQKGERLISKSRFLPLADDSMTSNLNPHSVPTLKLLSNKYVYKTNEPQKIKFEVHGRDQNENFVVRCIIYGKKEEIVHNGTAGTFESEIHAPAGNSLLGCTAWDSQMQQSKMEIALITVHNSGPPALQGLSYKTNFVVGDTVNITGKIVQDHVSPVNLYHYLNNTNPRNNITDHDGVEFKSASSPGSDFTYNFTINESTPIGNATITFYGEDDIFTTSNFSLIDIEIFDKPELVIVDELPTQFDKKESPFTVNTFVSKGIRGATYDLKAMIGTHPINSLYKEGGNSTKLQYDTNELPSGTYNFSIYAAEQTYLSHNANTTITPIIFSYVPHLKIAFQKEEYIYQDPIFITFDLDDNDPDDKSTLYYSINGESYKADSTQYSNGTFNWTVPVPAYYDGELKLSFYAQDSYGAKSETISTKLKIRVKPEIAVEFLTGQYITIGQEIQIKTTLKGSHHGDPVKIKALFGSITLADVNYKAGSEGYMLIKVKIPAVSEHILTVYAYDSIYKSHPATNYFNIFSKPVLTLKTNQFNYLVGDEIVLKFNIAHQIDYEVSDIYFSDNDRDFRPFLKNYNGDFNYTINAAATKEAKTKKYQFIAQNKLQMRSEPIEVTINIFNKAKVSAQTEMRDYVALEESVKIKLKVVDGLPNVAVPIYTKIGNKTIEQSVQVSRRLLLSEYEKIVEVKIPPDATSGEQNFSMSTEDGVFYQRIINVDKIKIKKPDIKNIGLSTSVVKKLKEPIQISFEIMDENVADYSDIYVRVNDGEPQHINQFNTSAEFTKLTISATLPEDVPGGDNKLYLYAVDRAELKSDELSANIYVKRTPFWVWIIVAAVILLIIIAVVVVIIIFKKKSDDEEEEDVSDIKQDDEASDQNDQNIDDESSTIHTSNTTY